MTGSNWKNLGKWSWSYIVAWAVWIVGFVVLEGIAILDNNDATPTLTEVVTRFVPGFLLFMGIGWLGWHFIASYHEHKLLGDEESTDPKDIE